MEHRQIIIFGLVLLFVINIVYGTEYFTSGTKNFVKIHYIDEKYELKGKDAFIQVKLKLLVEQNFTDYYKDFVLYFERLEVSKQSPAINIDSSLCGGGGRCVNIIPTKRFRAKNYNKEDLYDYYYNISPPKTDGYILYSLKINYTIPNFIIQQGDSQVLWLRTYCQNKETCPKDISVEKWVVLPTNTSVPISFPDSARVTMQGDKWAFLIKGNLNKNQFIWFKDEEQIKNRRMREGVGLTLLGVLIGFFLSLLVRRLNNHNNQ